MDHPRLKDIFLWAVGRRKRFVISGPSMLPTLKAGDHVLVDSRTHLRRPLKPSEIVLFRQPDGDVFMVKRVYAVSEHHIEVRGDNEAQSVDSRHFGRVPLNNLVGVVCAKSKSNAVFRFNGSFSRHRPEQTYYKVR